MTRPVVHLCATPTPYRNAEWDYAARHLGPERVRLIFVDDFYDTACWSPQFPRVCPFNTINGSSEHGGLPLEELPAYLDRLNPLVVIVSGYLQRAYLDTMRWCRRRRVPYCLRSAGNIYLDRYKGLLRYLVRRVRLGRWVHGADRVLVTGTYNRRFWQRYGMTPQQEFWFPQWIDYELFRQGRHLRETQHDELRRQFNIQPPVTIFTAGRILQLKRIDLLCEALLRLDDRVGLVVAGHGELEAELRQRYAERLGPRLMFVGDVEPADLPKWYAATDIYALASAHRDMWAHVITEAGTSAMPILCNYRTGAAGDLLIDGKNGFALRTQEPGEWAQAIGRLVDDDDLRRRMGAESARIVDAWEERSNPAQCIQGLIDLYSK